MPLTPPPAVVNYARRLADVLRTQPDLALVGVYLHGSAVLGGFGPGSDIDVLAVAAGPMAPAAQQRTGQALVAAARPCPGTELEFSAITAATAADLGDCRFEVHLAAGGAADQLVIGAAHPGDPDLVLYAEVCRRHGYAVVGPPADRVFAPVPAARLLAAVRQEVGWGLAHSHLSYAVLNACRAWRFALEDALCSKVAAGKWALARWPDQPLIAEALSQQRAGHRAPVTGDAVRLITTIQAELSGWLSR